MADRKIAHIFLLQGLFQHSEAMEFAVYVSGHLIKGAS
jgi:hypothetical protein